MGKILNLPHRETASDAPVPSDMREMPTREFRDEAIVRGSLRFETVTQKRVSRDTVLALPPRIKSHATRLVRKSQKFPPMASNSLCARQLPLEHNRKPHAYIQTICCTLSAFNNTVTSDGAQGIPIEKLPTKHHLWRKM